MQRITLLIFTAFVAWGCSLVFVSAPIVTNTLSMPSLTPLPYRDIAIDVLTEPEPDSLFVIGEIFDLRNREGFQIWTHQSHFWQPGDFFDANSLDVEVVFDQAQIVEPFIFWRSSAMRDVYDEKGLLSGRFLAADMNISVNTSWLDLGEHVLRIQVQTPHGKTFSHSWQFVVRDRETPRMKAPLEIVPTAEYLSQFPVPTPVFLVNLSTQPILFDHFSPIGNREGLCLILDDDAFAPLVLTNNPFRSSIWDEITVAVDNILLNANQIGIQDSDSPGVSRLCFDTDFLAVGTHIAELSVKVGGTIYIFPWVFIIE